MSESELKPVICIGWPTIRKLAAGEEVDVGSAILIAADGLYGERAPSPVVAEVVKEMRQAAIHGPGETQIETFFEDLIARWASRLERGE